jgi:hypothetical protein
LPVNIDAWPLPLFSDPLNLCITISDCIKNCHSCRHYLLVSGLFSISIVIIKMWKNICIKWDKLILTSLKWVWLWITKLFPNFEILTDRQNFKNHLFKIIYYSSWIIYLTCLKIWKNSKQKKCISSSKTYLIITQLEIFFVGDFGYWLHSCYWLLFTKFDPK